eukprot:scaffold102904_cov67-Phaeocystis_antarctica.AAC.3
MHGRLARLDRRHRRLAHTCQARRESSTRGFVVSDRARRFRSAETGRNCAETRSAVFCSPPYSYTHGTGDLLYTSSRAAAQAAEAERADEES